MAKKFKFKLEALLKLRRFAEEKCKMKIGSINKEILERRETIIRLNNDIDLSFADTEKTLRSATSYGLTLKFHPYFVAGKRAHIQKMEEEIEYFSEQLEEAKLELAQKRAQTKVLSNMKETQLKEYKKDINKRRDSLLEEEVRAWFLRNQKS